MYKKREICSNNILELVSGNGSVAQVEVMASDKCMENPSKRTGNKAQSVGVNPGR